MRVGKGKVAITGGVSTRRGDMRRIENIGVDEIDLSDVSTLLNLCAGENGATDLIL